MNEIVDKLGEWTGAGERVAVATVIDVKRSAPRPPGAKMAVSESGDVEGMVSGGCVEGAVVQAAEQVIRDGRPQLLHFGIADSDAWDVGLPCGGEIDVWVERYELDESARRRPPAGALDGDGLRPAALEGSRFAEIAAAGGRAAAVTVLSEGPNQGAKLLVLADGAVEGTLGDPALDGAATTHAEELMWAERSEKREEGDVTLFVDIVHPAPRLFAFGAVDYAAALCTLARATGWRPYVIDPRGRFATRERFPDAEDVVAEWPEPAVARLGGIDRATAIAVLTHDPKLDDAAVTLALRSEAGYIGAMGSRRAQAARRERLLAAGVTEEELARVRAPIGLDLGGLTAEETALSIIAEVVAARHGRGGGMLSAAGSRRIHEVGSS